MFRIGINRDWRRFKIDESTFIHAIVLLSLLSLYSLSKFLRTVIVQKSTNVNFDVLLTVKPTVIIRPPSPVELNEGDSTTFVCEASGFPYLSIAFVRRNAGFPAIWSHRLWGIRRRSLTLPINSANNKDHAGRYTCTVEVSSPGGLSPISANYTIDVRVRCKLFNLPK